MATAASATAHISCGPKAIRWAAGASAAHSLRTQQFRSFVPFTTDPAVRAAPNRLLGQLAPTALNQTWMDNSTYLPRQGGCWLYLSVWLDHCSRKIMGWDVRDTIPEDLVSEALRLGNAQAKSFWSCF